MPASRQTLGFLIGLVAIAIFGASLPSTRVSVLHLDPLFVTAMRTLVAGAVAVALVVVRRAAFPRDHLALLLGILACIVVGFPLAMAFATVSVPSAHGGVVLGLLPLATTIGAVLFAGERPSAWFWLLSIAGAAVVTAYALRADDLAIVAGDFLLIGAVLCAGFGYAMSGRLSRSVPGWHAIAWPLVLTLPVAVPATWLLWPADAAAAPAVAWMGIVFSGVVVLFVGYALWNVAMAWGGVARVGQLQLLQPFVTFLIAAAFLHETIDGSMIAFAIAVAVIVALGRRAAVAGPAAG